MLLPGGDLLKYLAESKSSIPFILCSSMELSEIPEAGIYPILGSVLKPDVFRPLVALIEKLRPIGDSSDNKLSSQFFRVSLEVIAKIHTVCCPLFIQLSESKFIKVFNTGDEFSKEEETRFRNTKKLDSLYVRVDDCEIFVNALAKSTIQIQSFTDKLNNPKSIQRLADLIDDPVLKNDLSDIAMMLRVTEINAPNNILTAESLKPFYRKALAHVEKLGFTPEVMALVTANVNLALSVVMGTDSLKESLKNLFNQKGGHESHSVDIAYLACSIASVMPWKSDAARHKLALAAFLHDIELAGDSAQEVDLMHPSVNLTAKEKRRIREHPEKVVAKLKSQNCNFAYNIEQILLQHHERPDGTGYPRKLMGSAIDPLASVFIVAHDLVQYIESNSGHHSLPDFLKLKEEEYKVGHFHKIVVAMQSLGM